MWTAVAGCVAILGAVLVPQGIEHYEEARYVAEWDGQTPLLIDAVERIEMPEGYEPIGCSSAETTVERCWRTPAAPDEVHPDLVAALTAADLTRVTSECEDFHDGSVMYCGATGYPVKDSASSDNDRHVGATVGWEGPLSDDLPEPGSVVQIGALIERP